MTKHQDKKLIELLHLACRIRDGNKCLKCGKQGRLTKEDEGTYLQLSHIKSVGAYPRLKYYLVNVKLLCFSCHLGSRGWHREPSDNWEWFKKTFPLRAREIANLVRKYHALPKPNYEQVKSDLEEYCNEH